MWVGGAPGKGNSWNLWCRQVKLLQGITLPSGTKLVSESVLTRICDDFFCFTGLDEFNKSSPITRRNGLGSGTHLWRSLRENSFCRPRLIPWVDWQPEFLVTGPNPEYNKETVRMKRIKYRFRDLNETATILICGEMRCSSYHFPTFSLSKLK